MRLLATLFFHLLALGLAVAQTPLNKEPLLRFRAISCLGANPVDLYYKAKDNHYALITAFSDHRSTFCDLHYSTNEIIFYRKTSDPKIRKDVYTAIGSVDISGKGHIPLLLFLPDPTVPSGFAVRALNDDAESFPAGTFRYLNLTTRPLIVSLNKSPTTIASDADYMTPPSTDTSDASVAIGVMHDRDIKLLFTDIWGTSRRTRTLVLLYLISGEEGGFTVGRITDYPNGWKPVPPNR